MSLIHDFFVISKLLLSLVLQNKKAFSFIYADKPRWNAVYRLLSLKLD